MCSQNLDAKLVEEIDREIISLICEVGYNSEMSYVEKVAEITDAYIKKIDGVQFSNKKVLIEHVKENWNVLEKSIDSYLKGDIQKCFGEIKKRLIKEPTQKEPTETYYVPIYDIKDKTLYRCRKNEEGHTFSELELFHVPFTKRGIVSTMRFSIPGFPCLYMGSTPFCCWKELNMPESFTIAEIKCNQSVCMMDMRFWRCYHLNETEMRKYLISYPFRIACSIPVMEEHYNDNFKPEYIIPQILLHTSVIGNKDSRFDGIVTTSTKFFASSCKIEEIRDFDNYIVPARECDKLDEKGYCDWLLKRFDIKTLHDSRCEDSREVLCHQ